MLNTIAAVFWLFGARALHAQSSISPSVQAAAGSVTMSSGTHQVASSGPQIAAAAIINGAHAIQSGFFGFLEAVGITAATQLGQSLTQTIYPAAGPATLSVPAGALASGVTITLSIPTSAPVNLLSGLVAIPGTAIQIECGGCQPLKAVTLTLSFAQASLGTIDPSRLTIARFDETRQLWVPLFAEVDAFNKTVVGTVRHFSVFQIMASVPRDNVNSVRAVPNPFTPAKGHTGMGFFNLPPSSRVRIYTYSGELLKDLTANGAGLATWDGTNTYGAKVGSGVYYAFVQGQNQARTITVAVQR